MNSVESPQRVIVNTGVQYLRALIAFVVTLYTARVVLANLGFDDYGIYSVIAGVVTMLSFIQGNLARTSQRYLAFYQGKGDRESVIRIFNNCVCTQLIVAVILCGLLLLSTPLVFRYLLNIATDRLASAHIVYYLSVAMLFFNLLGTPYLAALITRENIVYSSIVQIADALLKIPIAQSLIYISDNKLEWYSLMLCGISVFNLLCYVVYCHLKYEECRSFSFRSFDPGIFKDMFSFMGWNVYGTLCVTGRTHGIALLLNNFFTVTINSAYGIANQVMGQLSFVSNSLTNAINPRIIKAEGAGDRRRMLRLTEISCKFSFILLSVIVIPAVLHIDTILKIWLGKVPDYTSLFCVFILLSALIDQLTVNLTAANHAVGNVKSFNLRLYTIKLMTLPVAWFILRMGWPVKWVMVDYLAFETICAVARLIFIHDTTGLSYGSFFRNVLFPVLPVVAVNAVVCYLASRYLDGWWFLLTFCISLAVTLAVTLTISLNDEEKELGREIFKMKKR